MWNDEQPSTEAIVLLMPVDSGKIVQNESRTKQDGQEKWLSRLTCVKVLVCIVEAWMCSTTRSTNGFGPVTKPIRNLPRKHHKYTEIIPEKIDK